MFLAKHHYAITLAQRGNRVFFLNPPALDQVRFSENIQLSTIQPNLVLVEHTLFFPAWLRFKATWLFHLLMRLHVWRIRQKLPPLDVVWSFDLGNYYPFRFWGKRPLRIYHPIDEPPNHHAFAAAEGTDVIFSVTREILEKFHDHPAPKHFVHHGAETEFFRHANPERPTNQPLRCGLSGNLIRGDLDRPTLLRIFRENPDVQFDCWGSYQSKDSNVGGGDSLDLQRFIAEIKTLPNVALHGPVPPHHLAKALHQMDMLLICYDILKDQSRGTNYHKVMEYLSTGKVIVSNNITTYADRPDLVTMTVERDHNDALPALFQRVAKHLEDYNSPDQQRVRITFAQENTYDQQLERIVQYLLPFRGV